MAYRWVSNKATSVVPGVLPEEEVADFCLHLLPASLEMQGYVKELKLDGIQI